jgi:hypothetical protein
MKKSIGAVYAETPGIEFNKDYIHVHDHLA